MTAPEEQISELNVFVSTVVDSNHKRLFREMTRVAPFLELLKPEKLALITILEVRSHHSSPLVYVLTSVRQIMRLHGTGGIADGMKTARALLVVGKAVESEYKVHPTFTFPSIFGLHIC